MTLKIAVQMDPIEAIDITGDSTFALMLEAQGRGHELFEYHADTLALRDGRLSATGADVKVRDEVGRHFDKSENRTVQLEDYDAVLMRQDPPFDMNYITYTHMLEAIHPKTLVVNDPAEVRNAPEKLYVLQYNEFIPPTLISRDPKRLSEFRDEFGDIILKPLYGNGGAGVFRLAHGDENFASLMEMFTQSFREPFIAQQYLADVKKGDKRIILVDGEPVGRHQPGTGSRRNPLQHACGPAGRNRLT